MRNPTFRSHTYFIFTLVLTLSFTTLSFAGPSNLRSQVWQSPDVSFAGASGLAESPTLLFAYSGDQISAVQKSDGQIAWQSPVLESSAGFGSWSSPIYEAGAQRVAIASGLTTPTFYLLDAADGSIVWDTPLPSVDGVVNATPAFGAGRYYVHSNPSFFDPSSSTLYALDATTGLIDWQADDGGNGSSKPIIDGGNVYDFVFIGGQHGVRSYNAATGAVNWTSTPTLSFPPFGGMTLDSGSLYFQTFDFGDSDPMMPTGELVKLDAATGALEYNVPSPSGDAFPAVGGGLVYTLGAFSYGKTTAYNSTTGAEVWSRDEGFWNTTPILSGGNLYYSGHPDGGFSSFASLYVVDAATGLYLDSIDRPGLYGTPLINGTTIYIGGNDGSIYAYDQVADEVKISELFLGSSTEDYITLENVGAAMVDLNGWEIQADDGTDPGDDTGYVTVVTISLEMLAAAGSPGDSLRFGSVTHTPSSITPDVIIPLFDLPDLTGADTVLGVRIVNPAGDVIDTVRIVDGTATGTSGLHAASDTGSLDTAGAITGVQSFEAIQRNVANDTNSTEDDYIIEDFGLAVTDWMNY